MTLVVIFSAIIALTRLVESPLPAGAPSGISPLDFSSASAESENRMTCLIFAFTPRMTWNASANPVKM